MSALVEHLYRVVGPEEFVRLLALFGGRSHYLPKLSGCRALIAERDATIAADWRLGVPTSEIARRCGCSVRTVQRVLRKPLPNNDTPCEDLSRISA